ncbi:hypothetical protein C8Q76DRAFT_724913 [Earliella scabrosa]|nr:hypothetical protein C8Q76DRAFT_724913 [Earliella scabrosa]
MSRSRALVPYDLSSRAPASPGQRTRAGRPTRRPTLCEGFYAASGRDGSRVRPCRWGRWWPGADARTLGRGKSAIFLVCLVLVVTRGRRRCMLYFLVVLLVVCARPRLVYRAFGHVLLCAIALLCCVNSLCWICAMYLSWLWRRAAVCTPIIDHPSLSVVSTVLVAAARVVSCAFLRCVC